MILILSFPFYKIVSYTYMGIRIAINSDVVIHNCWEWEHIPIWWSWKVKNLRIYGGSCRNSPWVRSFDLSRYKNLKTLDVGRWCFWDVKRVKISGLNQLESVTINYWSLMNHSSIRFESDDMRLMRDRSS